MNAWDNAFERRWTIIFLAEILFIILPFPFFYDVNYTPWFFRGSSSAGSLTGSS